EVEQELTERPDVAYRGPESPQEALWGVDADEATVVDQAQGGLHDWGDRRTLPRITARRQQGRHERLRLWRPGPVHAGRRRAAHGQPGARPGRGRAPRRPRSAPRHLRPRAVVRRRLGL